MCDITVRGAGIAGLSVAWAALKRGASVRVVDPAGTGAGASGGIVGALAPHVPENWNEKKAFQLESLLLSETWWTEVAAAGGEDAGYARDGRLQPLDPAARGLAEARGETARTHWQDHAIWVVEPAPNGDWTPGTAHVIRDTLSARIHPARACASLAAAIETQGGQIVVEASDAGQVVHATGWQGLSAIRNAAGRPAGIGIKGQAVLFALDRAGAPQLFVDTLHVVPHADGTVAVGSTTEREFDNPDGTDGKLDDIIDRVRRRVPALADAPVVQRWAGVRPRARTRAPMLGAWPGRPGHYIANGGFKIGFGMAPLAAERLVDLILEGRDTVPESFRPEASL